MVKFGHIRALYNSTVYVLLLTVLAVNTVKIDTCNKKV